MTDILPFKRKGPVPDLSLGFLNSPGHKRDADFYLNHFLSFPAASFAILVLNEDILRDELDAVLFEVRYLMRLGLYPLVLIQSTDAFLERLEIESYFKRAKMALNFMSCDLTDEEKAEFVKVRIEKNMIPLVHVDPNKSLFKEIWNFAHLFKSHKIILLKKQGGLVNTDDNHLISIVNLSDADNLLRQTLTLNDDDSKLLKNCEGLIRKLAHPNSLSIISPNNILRELLTVKGAGTLIHTGSRIVAHTSWATVDRLRLTHLLQTQSQTHIADTFFHQDIERCYVEEEYRGVAVLQAHKGMSYLSHFCAGVEARGLGVGKDLWSELSKNHPKIFWKSRTDDFITHWYVKQCDGMHKTGDWTVFWRGLLAKEISEAVSFAIDPDA